MTDYAKYNEELAAAGFTPGRLVTPKNNTYFWNEFGTPVFEKLELAGGTSKEWIRGEKIVLVDKGTVLMFLGLLEREVGRSEVHSLGVPTSTEYTTHTLLCFLYGDKVVWWHYESIDAPAVQLSIKFEAIPL